MSCCSPVVCPHSLFVFEKATLDVGTKSKSGERAVRADDAMTRHDHRYGVAAVGGTDRARGSRATDATRLFAICDGFTERNLTQRLPRGTLKRGALGSEREIESRESTFEIGAHLCDGFVEHIGWLPHPGDIGRYIARTEEIEAGHMGPVRDNGEHTKG